MKSSVALTFLKNYFKDMKKIKNNLFKKTFLKSSLQKYSDKLYSKCCKIFKAYLTTR